MFVPGRTISSECTQNRARQDCEQDALLAMPLSFIFGTLWGKPPATLPYRHWWEGARFPGTQVRET